MDIISSPEKFRSGILKEKNIHEMLPQSKGGNAVVAPLKSVGNEKTSTDGMENILDEIIENVEPVGDNLLVDADDSKNPSMNATALSSDDETFVDCNVYSFLNEEPVNNYLDNNCSEENKSVNTEKISDGDNIDQFLENVNNMTQENKNDENIVNTVSYDTIAPQANNPLPMDGNFNLNQTFDNFNDGCSEMEVDEIPEEFALYTTPYLNDSYRIIKTPEPLIPNYEIGDNLSNNEPKNLVMNSEAIPFGDTGSKAEYESALLSETKAINEDALVNNVELVSPNQTITMADNSFTIESESISQEAKSASEVNEEMKVSSSIELETKLENPTIIMENASFTIEPENILSNETVVIDDNSFTVNDTSLHKEALNTASVDEYTSGQSSFTIEFDKTMPIDEAAALNTSCNFALDKMPSVSSTSFTIESDKNKTLPIEEIAPVDSSFIIAPEKTLSENDHVTDNTSFVIESDKLLPTETTSTGNTSFNIVLENAEQNQTNIPEDETLTENSKDSLLSETVSLGNASFTIESENTLAAEEIPADDSSFTICENPFSDNSKNVKVNQAEVVKENPTNMTFINKLLTTTPTNLSKDQKKNQTEIAITENLVRNDTVTFKEPAPISPFTFAQPKPKELNFDDEEFHASDKFQFGYSDFDCLLSKEGESFAADNARCSVLLKFDPLLQKPEVFVAPVPKSPVLKKNNVEMNMIIETDLNSMKIGESDNLQMADLEKKVKNDVLKTEELEKKLKDALKKISEKDKVITKMIGVVEAYEKTIAETIADKENSIREYERQIVEIKSDRDLNAEHLASLESTFSDLHAKYERTKIITATLKESEAALIIEKKKYAESLKMQEQYYEKMKAHAISQLEIANNKLSELTKAHNSEITKLKAQLKKEEISRASVNEQLNQKSIENEELVKICDELIKGGSTS